MRPEGDILTKLYEKFFENYVIGMSTDSIIQQFSSNYNENAVKIAINDLEHRGLIYRDQYYWKITTSGIDSVEDDITYGDRKRQRSDILDILRQSYLEDVDRKLPHDVFIEKLGLKNLNDILSQMVYLRDIGCINLELALGGNFWASLTPSGLEYARY